MEAPGALSPDKSSSRRPCLLRAAGILDVAQGEGPEVSACGVPFGFKAPLASVRHPQWGGLQPGTWVPASGAGSGSPGEGELAGIPAGSTHPGQGLRPPPSFPT